ncbi:MAG TPA: hypothetical protein VFM05_14445, partial [Candidatus Saccharimonadales bacterium]|nr:hypothetical protein [Candidatus Saccharimonadales bacterium]
MLLGLVLGVPFGAKLTGADCRFSLMYPTISRTQRHWEFMLMHVFVTLFFAVVWYYVLNEY